MLVFGNSQWQRIDIKMSSCSGLQKWFICTMEETGLRDYSHTQGKTLLIACVLIRFSRNFSNKDGKKYIKRYHKIKFMVRDICSRVQSH
jgi:hypothetical protein